MATITKKELIDRIAETHKLKRVMVKKVVQQFLDEIVVDLSKGNRLEFRDFGVFEVRIRRARKAQNPKTLSPVHVPSKRTVKFKIGRIMKQQLLATSGKSLGSSSAGASPNASASPSTNSPSTTSLPPSSKQA